ALATSGNRSWGAMDTVQGNWITTAGPPTGVMIGSPWMNYMAGQAGVGSPPCRIVQHGLPSEAVFYDQVNNARKVYFAVTSLGREEKMYGQTRNGYTSVPDMSGYLICVCRLIIYWDGEKAQKMDPYLGIGPT